MTKTPLRTKRRLLVFLAAAIAVPASLQTAAPAAATDPGRGTAPVVAPAAVVPDSPAARAKTTGQRVELVDRRTATSQLFVEPSGLMTLEQSAVQPAAVDKIWTHVNRKFPDDEYWDKDRGEGAKVGYAYDQSGNVYRSFFQIPTDQINGSRIVSASFSIVLHWSPSGEATPVNLFETKPVNGPGKESWNDTAGHWTTYLATQSATAWNRPAVEMGFENDNVKAMAQRAADDKPGYVTVGLAAPNENGTWESRIQWKKFHPDTAKMIITFNNAPRQPIKLNLTRPRPCGTAEKPTLLNTTQPTFAAVASDPDGHNINNRLLIRNAADNSLVYEQDSGTTSSGAAFSWPAVAAEKLVHGGTYSVSARSDDGVAGDGLEHGPESGRCYYTIDTTRPKTAVIQSTDYPNGSSTIPARTVGILNLRPATGDTDIVEYLYGFAPERILQRIKADGTGLAKLPLTVWQSGGSFPSATVYILAVDRAGNVSPTPRRWDALAKSNSAEQPRKRGDVNGDGRADISAVLDQGFGRTAIWNVLSGPNGLHTGEMAYDTRENGGFPLFRTRPAQGDFDGDGRTDTAMFREEAGRRIALYSLKSDGNKYDPDSLPVWRSPANAWALSSAHIIAGNVDNDTKSDIAVQLNNGNGTWRVEMFLGSDLTKPVTWLASAPGQWAESAPLLADIDGDGDDDLVSMRNAGSCRTVTEVYKSTGIGFATTPVTLLDSGAGAFCWERSRPAVGDVDGDGKDDLVTLYENQPGQPDLSLKVLRSTGTSLVQTEWWRDTSRFDPAKVALSVGDFDNDLKDDVGLFVALDDGGREALTLKSTGTSFAAPVSGWTETAVGASTGPKFDIEHRTYELVARHSGRCLDVWNASLTDPAPLVQHDCLNGLNQRFRLHQIAGTEQFELHMVHVDGTKEDGRPRCLDVGNQSTDDGVALVQWQCAGQANQQMAVEYVEGSSYDTVVRLKFAHSGKCAGVENGTVENAKPVVQQTCAAVASQQWVLRPALNLQQLDNRYGISAIKGGRYLDIEDCVMDEGANLRTWGWVEDSRCERWRIIPLGDDIYQVAAFTGQLMQVEGCSQLNETKIEIGAADSSDCQRWRIEPAADGSWSIHEPRTGKAVDVAGCWGGDDAALILWDYWNGPCQRYRLEVK
ncbi:RICIN domain-containing protein [Kribbella sp. NPDC056345]|uniref:RICIN domain-containing protein n=1 Tax=Kribbella sp. NPDC056345 TaxID=3345789 RepID=UPI0035DD9A12